MPDSKVTKLGRMPEGALDDYYIREFLEKPGNKKEAYLNAYGKYVEQSESQGIEVTRINENYAYQYAKALHDRLRERISNELYRLAEDDKALGASVLREIAGDKDAPHSARVASASTLAKGLYPDVQISKQETIDDIDRELEQVEKELSAGLH